MELKIILITAAAIITPRIEPSPPSDCNHREQQLRSQKVRKIHRSGLVELNPIQKRKEFPQFPQKRSIIHRRQFSCDRCRFHCIGHHLHYCLKHINIGPRSVFRKKIEPANARTNRNSAGVGSLKKSPIGIWPLKIKSSIRICSKFSNPRSPSNGTGPKD